MTNKRDGSIRRVQGCAIRHGSTVLPTTNGICGTDLFDVTPFQSWSFLPISTQGVALGWYIMPFQGWISGLPSCWFVVPPSKDTADSNLQYRSKLGT